VRRRTTSVCDLWLRLETLIFACKSHDSAADQQLMRAHSKTAACPVQEHSPIIYRCQPYGILDPSLEEVTIVLHTYIETTGQEFAGQCRQVPSWSTHQHARHWRRAMVTRVKSPQRAGDRSMLTYSGAHPACCRHASAALGRSLSISSLQRLTMSKISCVDCSHGPPLQGKQARTWSQLPKFPSGDTVQHNMWSVAKMCCANTTLATRMLGSR
jgi:hypothetical protein